MLTNASVDQENLKKIHQDIQKHSPHPKKVTIIAVTKTFSYTAIQSAENNNIFHIGESKIQETQKKIANKKFNPKTQIHLIGHLQSNKVSLAVQIYKTIHSVDSFKLLNKINKSAEKQNKQQQIFLQLNITENPKQTGFKKQQINEAAKTAKTLPFIQTTGIMCIGTHKKNKTTNRAYFKKVKQAQEHIQRTIDRQCVYLSLGMSQDYILALQEGSTHLRLGTALFQKRHEE